MTTVESPSPVTGCPAEFAHAALIVDADDDLRRALVPQVRRCVEQGEDVLLVVGDHTRATLSAELSALSEHVRWASPITYHQRLGFAYESFRRLLAARHDSDRRLHVVAEPDVTSDGEDVPVDRAAGYLAYEAACNDTFAPYDSPVTCIWDSRRYPAGVIDDVRATHAYELTPPGLLPSPSFLPPERFLADHSADRLTEVPRHVDEDFTLTDAGGLSTLRATLTAWSARRGFARQPADDIVVAAVEIATNGLHHAASPVRIRAWQHGDTLIVQCDDTGGLPVPASAGYRRPDMADATPGGRGLWLARQLADVVTVDSAPGRTRVRLYFPYAVSHRDAEM